MPIRAAGRHYEMQHIMDMNPLSNFSSFAELMCKTPIRMDGKYYILRHRKGMSQWLSFY
jgi:hypothetical protein